MSSDIFERKRGIHNKKQASTRLLKFPLCLPASLQNILKNPLTYNKLKVDNSIKCYMRSTAYILLLCIILCPRLLSVA